jgi:hypothetical protein
MGSPILSIFSHIETLLLNTQKQLGLVVFFGLRDEIEMGLNSAP